MKKTIGIDARLYGEYVSRGIGRYIREIVDGILAVDRENEYVIFLSGDNYHKFEPYYPNVKKILVTSRWYSLKEQFEVAHLVRKHKIDLMHFPHFNVPFFCTTPFIVTIHDLILTKFPTKRASTLSPFLYYFKNIFYKIIIKRAVKRAKKIIAVSKFTKNDIVEQFNASSEKIKTIYEGVSVTIEGGKKGDNDDKLSYNFSKPYLLYVGSAYPHKNLELLVKVFSKIKEKRRDLSLVIVGREDYFLKRLKEFVGEEGVEVFFPGFVPDEDLSILYREATAFVYPSLYEGFGLPPLEAMLHSCPVVSSDASCLPEVLEDSACFYSSRDPKDLEEKVIKILDDHILRDDLTRKGREQVKKYSWETAVKKTYQLLKENL